MSKKNETAGPTEENLIERHRKARTRRRRKTIITVSIIIIVVLVAIAVGVSFARAQIAKQVSSSEDEVQSAEVTTGSISTTVSGSGTLAEEDVESVEIPSDLEISEFYVEEGDSVEEGDLIATVTNASLLTAMSSAQASLDSLDEEIEETSGDEVDETMTASVSGRIKYIYVASGDDVATAMYEYGALMLMSLDGYMSVEIESDELEAGDSVTVITSDGTSYSGSVEKNESGTATILVTDNGPTYQDTVTVTDSDGEEIGTGTLSIHSQMLVTGYAGTVSTISVSVNASVSAGDTLLTLTDTETSANYDTLLKEREEAEELLADLIKIYKEGGVCATSSGAIVSLTETTSSSASGSSAAVSSSTSMSGSTSGDSSGSGTSGSSSSSSSGSEYTTIATITPDENMVITISVDETDILSLSEGQEATVSIDSIGEDTFTGTVTSISTSASSSSGVTSYSADITIEKTDSMLSGMSASVSIIIEGVDNALLIPVDALHQTSSTSYVYTEYDESTGEFSGMVEVTTGLSNSSYVEITDGLSEGDTVYYTESSSESTEFSMDFSDMDMSNFGGSSGGDSGFSGGGNSGGDMPSMPGGN